MKGVYILSILFDAFMIWFCGDTMFRLLNEGRTGLAALNLAGVIFWVLLMIDNKNDLLKERDKEKKEEKLKKNLED